MNELQLTRSTRALDEAERDPLVDFARRWWWLLSLGAIFGIAAGVVYSRVGPIPYESTALVQVVSASGVSSTADAAQTRSAASNFAAEASSPRIYALTSEALKGSLDVSASDLEAMGRNGMIAISASRTSNFVRITVTDPDPERARLLADTISQVFVEDVAQRANTAFETRQAQLDGQIQFTREQLATAALRQREFDLESQLRDQQSRLLTLQSNYLLQLERQAEFGALEDSFSESELTQQAEIQSQILQITGQQISDIEANIRSLNEDLTDVQAELSALPADTDGSLSAAFASAYTLELSTLTQQYASQQVAAMTASPPVLRYGNASTPIATQSIKKLGAFGLLGGLAAAAGVGLVLDLIRKRQNARSERLHEHHGRDYPDIPDLERLIAVVDELAAHDRSANGVVTRTDVPHAGRPPMARE